MDEMHVIGQIGSKSHEPLVSNTPEDSSVKLYAALVCTNNRAVSFKACMYTTLSRRNFVIFTFDCVYTL